MPTSAFPREDISSSEEEDSRPLSKAVPSCNEDSLTVSDALERALSVDEIALRISWDNVGEAGLVSSSDNRASIRLGSKSDTLPD